MPNATPPQIAQLAQELRLNAAAFIVTIYGDIVVPRGGVLWTGTLIDLCAPVGINESLVRTAVSRLVAAGQLRGERIGRRSFYRLASAARAEFEHAARLLFGPKAEPHGWQIIHAPDLRPEDARRQRMGHLGGPVFIRPDRDQEAPPGALVLHGEAPPASLEQLAQFWDMTALQARYDRFLALFAPLQAMAADFSPEPALIARLLLVHAWRDVLLRDPRLPAACLPQDWPGPQARTLFVTLYTALTPAAEAHIAAHCEGEDGLLPARTDLSQRRLPHF